MSDFRVIFPNNDGGVAIFVPAPGTTEQEALKCIPPNIPYKIVDASEIPSDRTFRDAWEVDFSEQDQVEGGE
jgi:hypothetical protein